MDDPVVPFDLVRMFLGTEPPLFYLEIIFRTCLIYVYALILIRWVGGRGIAQMSAVEFLLVIALGSAVGDAMFYPEVPLFHAMLVITFVVLINKALDRLIFRFRKAETLMNGRTSEVVRDGVINIDALRRKNIGHSELFESMRENGIDNLGAVRRAYLETSGKFSFFLEPTPNPGLPVEPPWGIAPPPLVSAGDVVPAKNQIACSRCGLVQSHKARIVTDRCPNCAEKDWVILKGAKGRSPVG